MTTTTNTNANLRNDYDALCARGGTATDFDAAALALRARATRLRNEGKPGLAQVYADLSVDAETNARRIRRAAR